MGSAASASPRSNPDQQSSLPAEINQLSSHSRTFSRRMHDEKAKKYPFYSKSFVDKAYFLAKNEWDRQVFIRYVLGEFWHHRVAPQLREQLARSASSLKASRVAVEDVSSHCVFGMEDLERFWSEGQCRALLLATVLLSFFDFRKNVDFNVVLEQNAPSLPAFVTALCVDDHRHLKIDHLYDDANSLFVDPEDILSMISMNCTVEDLDTLLLTPDWLDLAASAIEASPLALSIESTQSLDDSEGAFFEHTQNYLSDDSSSPIGELETIFANSANREMADNFSKISMKKIHSDVHQRDLRASRGHVLLSPRTVSETISDSESLSTDCTSLKVKNNDDDSLTRRTVSSVKHSKSMTLGSASSTATTHFFARLPVYKSTFGESDLTSGSFSQHSQGSNDIPSLAKRAQSQQTAILSEDEESNTQYTRSIDKNSDAPSHLSLGYVITASHEVSGGINEKAALKLVDFALFAVGALLCP